MSINAEGAYERWSSAVGNIEDAKVAVDIMARAIEDAVYLDEDAYNQMIPMQQYTRTIEVSFPCYPHTELYPFNRSRGAKLAGCTTSYMVLQWRLCPLSSVCILSAITEAMTMYNAHSQFPSVQSHVRWLQRSCERL